MESLLHFPAEANTVLGGEKAPLVNKRLCQQIAQDKRFMGKLLLFILKNMSAHRRLEEWTGLEWVAYYERFLFKTLATCMGPAGVIEYSAPQFSEDGEEISRQGLLGREKKS